MSIVKPKTSEGRLPADAFISFNGQLPGKIKLEIKNGDGTTSRLEPTKIKYIVIDEDFKEVGGIRMGAPQEESVKSNVCYDWEQNFFKVRLKNGTNVAAGPWGAIKQKCDLYKGRLENFSFVILLKIGGTAEDARINQMLSSGRVVAKVSYHGQTSMEYSLEQKRQQINDFAGYIIQVKSFKQVKSEKSGLFSAVPVFEASKADRDSPEYLNSVAAFLERIKPYIKYIQGGGTMEEVEQTGVPEATAADFADENGFARTEPAAQGGSVDEIQEDLPF